MRRVGITLCALIVGISLGGCSQNSMNATSAATTHTNNAVAPKKEVYHARGVVKELISPTRARIEHEAIAGYMPAMTMPLDAKNTNELANVKAGDRITFDLVVTDTDGWIEHVARVGQAPVAVAGDTNKGVTFSK